MLFVCFYICSGAVKLSSPAHALRECASFPNFKSFKAVIFDSALFYIICFFFIYLVQMSKSRPSAVLLSGLLFMFNTFSDFGTDVFTTNGSQEHNGPGLLKVSGLECSQERSQRAAGAPNPLHPVPPVGSHFSKASLYPNC